jgi:hypothetical protein
MMKKKEILYSKLSKLLKENICLTIEELRKSLNYSIISVRMFLKEIGYYSSFTHNSKWYTLQSIPAFDENGLWFYNKIGFSKHGNLTQTIIYFVNKSPHGLSAKKIYEIISMPCHAILNTMYKKDQIDRINTKSGFVYISKEELKREQQACLILQSKESPLPSDADAVRILVELIKNPDYTANELALSLLDKVACKPKSIARLLQYHELGKKTLNR